MLVLNYHVKEVKRTTILIFETKSLLSCCCFCLIAVYPSAGNSKTTAEQSKGPVLLEEYALHLQFSDSEEGEVNPNYIAERRLVAVITNDQSRQF